jgi:putative cardiolipin synthase
LPQQAGRERTYATTDTADTRLGRAVAPGLAAHPGLSGFYPLAAGADAFVARIGLARTAERSLDVQYYIYHADDTGLALLGELLAAADRGVRVRLLLDDIHSAGRDEVLAAIATHPNFKVRLFNPFAHRGARWVDLLTDFGRVNRRMHNKSMTADNQATIVGGRNIGDEYFSAGSDLEFSDLDVLAAGPVVSEVSAVFDEYWNSDVAYPVATLTAGREPKSELRKLRDVIAARVESLRGTPYARGLADTDFAKSIADGRLPAYWGEGRVIADQAVKVTLPEDDSSSHAIPRLAAVLTQAREELILVSPYFVPGRNGVRFLRELAQRGVRVRVLTNSFAATDVRAVHAGYSAYRRELLQAGIALYELKPTAGKHRADRGSGGSSRASLHAKAYMVDGRLLFVGSLNLDPRSARLNTEMGIVLESEALCARFSDVFNRQISEAAWRVELDRGASPEGERLVWITREGGRETRTYAEPGMGVLQGLGQGLLRLLPIEEQL